MFMDYNHVVVGVTGQSSNERRLENRIEVVWLHRFRGRVDGFNTVHAFLLNCSLWHV